MLSNADNNTLVLNVTVWEDLSAILGHGHDYSNEAHRPGEEFRMNFQSQAATILK